MTSRLLIERQSVVPLKEMETEVENWMAEEYCKGENERAIFGT